MLRLTVTLLIFISMVGAAHAGSDSAPAPGAAEKGTALYLYTHAISHTQHGEIKANNHLRVWSKDAKEMRFSLMTLANEYHECLLEGKATQTGNREYEYRENKCRMLFVFDENDVTLRATGASGESCRTEDLRPGHGCGFHTVIESATYQKAKKTVRPASR